MLMRQLCILLLFSPLLLVAQQRRVSAFIFQPEWYAGLHAGVNMMVAEGFPSYSWLQSTGVSARPVIGSQTLQADLMLSVSNLLLGYTLNAPLDVSLFAGVGALHRNTILPDNGYFSYLIRGGIQFDYRLNQALELNLLAELNVTDDKFNAFAVSTPVDMFPAVMLGLTWHFRTNKPFSRRCCD